MPKRTIVILMILALMSISIVGCMTLHHKVGKGATGSKVQTQRAWYAIWGLVPINEVDSKAMADGAENYEITSQTTFVDGLISAITGSVSITCQSVSVKK